MKTPAASNNFRKPVPEVERAQARVSTAERSVERAKAEAKAAKEKRAEAKKAARKAKKRVRRAKEELADAKRLLAESKKAALMAERPRPAKPKKKRTLTTATQPVLKPIMKKKRRVKPRVTTATESQSVPEPATPAISYTAAPIIEENQSQESDSF